MVDAAEYGDSGASMTGARDAESAGSMDPAKDGAAACNAAFERLGKGGGALKFNLAGFAAEAGGGSP